MSHVLDNTPPPPPWPAHIPYRARVHASMQVVEAALNIAGAAEEATSLLQLCRAQGPAHAVLNSMKRRCAHPSASVMPRVCLRARPRHHAMLYPPTLHTDQKSDGGSYR